MLLGIMMRQGLSLCMTSSLLAPHVNVAASIALYVNANEGGVVAGQGELACGHPCYA